MATKKLLIKKKNKNQYKDFSSNVSIYSFYGCFRTYAVKVYPQQTPKNLGASSFAVMLDPFWYIPLNDKSRPQSMYHLCLFIVVYLGAFLLNNVSPLRKKIMHVAGINCFYVNSYNCLISYLITEVLELQYKHFLVMGHRFQYRMKIP